MNINDRKKHRRAVHMGIAQEPAIIHVAHNSFDRIEGEIGAWSILHREKNAGDDHHYQHDPGERAVVPPITKIPRCRIFVQLVIQKLDEGQPIIDPPDDPARSTGAVIGHSALLADGHDGVAGEFVERLACPLDLTRQPQIQRCGTLAYPSGGVETRAVAGAEPAAVLTAVVTGFLAERDAAEMRAY